MHCIHSRSLGQRQKVNHEVQPLIFSISKLSNSSSVIHALYIDISSCVSIYWLCSYLQKIAVTTQSILLSNSSLTYCFRIYVHYFMLLWLPYRLFLGLAMLRTDQRATELRCTALFCYLTNNKWNIRSNISVLQQLHITIREM